MDNIDEVISALTKANAADAEVLAPETTDSETALDVELTAISAMWAKAAARSKLDAALVVDGEPIRFAEHISAALIPMIDAATLAEAAVEAAVKAKGDEYAAVIGAVD